MKLFSFLFLAFFGLVPFVAAIEPPNFFVGMDYKVLQGSATLSSNTTYYGYAKNINFRAVGGDVRWSSSFSNSTGTIVSAFNVQDTFAAPVSSPTVFRWTIPSGTTLYYFIGGHKND